MNGDGLERLRRPDEERALLLPHTPAFPREGDRPSPDARADRKVVAPDLLGELAAGGVHERLSVVETAARRDPERIAKRGLEAKEQHLLLGRDDEETSGLSFDVFHGGPGRIRTCDTRVKSPLL